MKINQLIPVINKKKYSSQTFIERALPLKGDISVKVGDTVEPFTRLGMTKISSGISFVPKYLKLAKGKFDSSYFYTGEKIGIAGLKKIVAPFDGYIAKSQNGYILTQEPKDFWLLSGVWGTVEKIKNNYSVLINTHTYDFNLAVSSNKQVSGEFIVFPNPSDILQVQYLVNFEKDLFGKIVYVGHYATYETVERALNLGVGGLLAGSTDKQTFEYAKQKNVNLALFSGFGRIETPDFIYDFLQDISNRFVFLNGEKNLFKVPVPAVTANNNESVITDVLVEPREGMTVQIFEKPFYGYVGKITNVQNDIIYVKLNQSHDEVQVTLPNLLCLN